MSATSFTMNILETDVMPVFHDAPDERLSVNILQFVQSRAAGWIIQLQLDAHQCFTVCHPPSGGNVSHTLI